jgi:hypothetical protein
MVDDDVNLRERRVIHKGTDPSQVSASAVRERTSKETAIIGIGIVEQEDIRGCVLLADESPSPRFGSLSNYGLAMAERRPCRSRESSGHQMAPFSISGIATCENENERALPVAGG